MENEKLVTPSLPLSLTIFAIIVTGLEEPEVEDDLLAREHPHLYIWLLKGIVICLLHWCIDDSLTLFVLLHILYVHFNSPQNMPSPSEILKQFLFLGKAWCCLLHVIQLLGDYIPITWWLEQFYAFSLIGLFLNSVSMAMDANDDQINNWMFLWRPYCDMQ